ncbi:MAG: ribonuclease HI [Deltaproteobacteria bacterium]|nr:ribonuclease HI [Deltaproteobacteria bacterium]
MPWIEAILRGQKVFARADANGQLVAEGGRVEIRYKPTDGRAYRAAKGNLEVVGTGVLPDDHCKGAEPVPSKYGQKKEKKAASAARVQPHAEGHFIAYGDGACSGNPGPAGSGVVIISPDGARREGYRYLGDRATNNVAELTAIQMALEAVPDRDAPFEIRTDSSYAIGVLQKGWKAKANPELIAAIKAELAQRKSTRLQYVPGHAGVALNERADELAREAIVRRGSKPIA